MKNCKILAAAAMMLAAVSCGQKATISGTVDGAKDDQLVVKKLDVNVYSVLDTIKTNANGAFSYSLEVKKGQPEFVYIFRNDTRVAGLLLETGEKAVVKADTLGNYSVEGSEGSEKLLQVDKSTARYISDLSNASDRTEIAKIYIDHYRANIKFLMENPFSLTTVPVIFERIGDNYTLSRPTDVLIINNVLDSLKTVYPESRYVKALEKESARRAQIMELDSQLTKAKEASYPDLNLPDIKGQRKALSEVDSKVILLHFWDGSNNAHKMLSVDTMLPLYNEYHSRGFEIYSVCISDSKADWATSVNSQKLPWINVCDGLGVNSPAVVAYNLATLPTTYLIANGELILDPIKGEAGLRKVLDRYLRQ